MQALATQALALIRVAEGWTKWNIFGGVLLLVVVLGLLTYWVFVTLRR